MTSAFVLDGSTAISWCFEETQTPYAIGVLEQLANGSKVYVSHIWPLEVTNALIKALRRKHISREELLQYTEQLASLNVEVDLMGANRAFTDIVALAETYQLTTYDASYLELAQRRGVHLASGDNNLLQAARAVKVPIVTI